MKKRTSMEEKSERERNGQIRRERLQEKKEFKKEIQQWQKIRGLENKQRSRQKKERNETR